MKRYFLILLATTLLLNMPGSWLSNRAYAAAVVQPGQAASPTAQANPSPYAIHLKSRSFIPAAGVPAAGLAQLQQQASSTGSRASTDSQTTRRIHALVQLNTIPDQAERNRLAAQGISLLEYIPDHAWLAAITVDQAALNWTPSWAHDPAVRWAGPLELADKVEANLLASLGGRGPAGESWLTVRFFADQDPQAAQGILAAYGGRVIEAVPEVGRYSLFLPAGRVQALASEDSVQWLEAGPPPQTTFNDESAKRTHTNLLWAAPYGLTGAGVNLGIWDGGQVDAHADFNGRLTIVDSAAGVSDHATHVAGTMAGDGFNSVNAGGTIHQWQGMAPAASIYSYYWDNSVIDHNAGINTFGIALSQNSWGYIVGQANCALYGDYAVTAPDYDKIVTGLYGKRLPVLFAAGNERNDGDCGMTGGPLYLNYHVLGPPGTAKNVITVGASMAEDDAMTTFSSWGPTDDGRVKPDVIAPGDRTTGGIESTYLGGVYAAMAGTSMATPAVSGISALVIEQYRDTYSSGDPWPSTLKATLIQTAVDMDDSSSYYNYGPDYASGYGRVDAKEAVDLVIAQQLHQGSLDDSQTAYFNFTVPDGAAEVKITLAWDDVAAASNAALTLVNDLDLRLVSPTGEDYLPYVLDPANPSADAIRGVDSLNNVEQVRLANPDPGVWGVVVAGAKVPSGPQTYSLAGAGFSPDNPPATPTSPDPVHMAGNQGISLDLSWTGGDPDSGDMPRYDVYLESGDSSPDVLKCEDQATASCATGNLQTNTTYYWQVISKDSIGLSTAGPVWRFTTANPPAAFTRTAPVDGATGLTNTPILAWNASAAATSYQVCYDKTDNDACDATWVNVGASTNQALSEIDPSTTYYWHVRASGPGGVTYAGSSASDFWSFTTAALPGEFAKTSPLDEAGDLPLNVTLTWQTSSNADGYEYCVDTTNDDACGAAWVSTGTSTSVSLNQLIPGMTYYWNVRSQGAGGYRYANGPSGWFKFTILLTPPDVFNRTIPADGARGVALDPTLTWEASAGASEFEYCIDTLDDNNCPSGWTSTGTNTSVNLTGLQQGATYYWLVRASGPGGITPANQGEWWSFTTRSNSLFLPLSIQSGANR